MSFQLYVQLDGSHVYLKPKQYDTRQYVYVYTQAVHARGLCTY